MGYKAQRRLYNLKFADPEMEGFELRAYGLKFGEVLDFGDLAAMATSEIKAEDLPKVMPQLMPVFDKFVANIQSWNLEDDNDQPIVPTVASLLANDPAWVMKVVDAWMTATMAVDLPLGKPSSDGAPSPVPHLPMAALSPSLTA